MNMIHHILVQFYKQMEIIFDKNGAKIPACIFYIEIEVEENRKRQMKISKNEVTYCLSTKEK